jgi:two-component system capsular synthesis sensor histidine kinase RcsC
LPVVAGASSATRQDQAAAVPVFVRAPIPELAQHYCDWLDRLGLIAHLAPPTPGTAQARAVLVDVLPDGLAAAWPGPRICCHATDSAGAEYSDLDLSMHDVQAIARAVGQVSQGHVAPDGDRLESTTNDLQLHILVAEDNPINRAILKEQLEALGCSVVIASNGEQALELWQPKVFDLVLTDVNMPVINGYELATELRELDPELPIIGVTANALREEGERCLEVGMQAWIVKPLSLQSLRTHLLKVCWPNWQDDAQQSGQPHPDTALPPDQDVPVKLSPAMRTLFINTMTQDIQTLRAALEQGDLLALGRQLHSIAGALGAVQVVGLAQRCNLLEVQLVNESFDESKCQQIREVLQSLATMIEALK